MALTALGQSVYLATGPLLGRLFSPEQFGLYGLFYTFTVTAALVVCLNYDLSIPAALDDEEAVDLTIGASLIAAVLSPVIALLFTLLCYSNSFGFGELPIWSGLLLVLVLLVQVAVQLMQSWRIRRQDMLVIGRAGVTLNFVRGGVQVLFGALSGSWWGLAAGEFVGRVANAYHLRGRSGPLWLRRRIDLKGNLRNTLNRYRQFPLILLPSQLVDSLTFFIQTASLALLFGPTGLGQYFLMRRTLDLPVAFAFRSLGDVFYARLAEDARVAPERIRPFFTRSFLLLAAAGTIGGLPLMIFGSQIFALVFGEPWRQAGLLAAIMTPAAIMNLAVAPVARIFALTSLPHLRFVFSGVYLVGTVAVILIVRHLSLDLVAATIGLSVVTFVSYLAYFVAGYVASSFMRSPAEVPSAIS